MSESFDPAVAALAARIDHSVLAPTATPDDVERGCDVALRHVTAAMCCRPADVARVAGRLAGSPVAVATVIGFPHGSTQTATKVFESERAIADGARELDMVIPIGLLLAGDLEAVRDDIGAVVAAAGDRAEVKVILENSYLTDEQKRIGCRLAVEAGAAFVKTSTGFAPTGATVDDVALMRATVGPSIGVKASGGIRTLAEFEAMVAAGADRCGVSATETILAEAAVRLDRADPVDEGGTAPCLATDVCDSCGRVVEPSGHECRPPAPGG